MDKRAKTVEKTRTSTFFDEYRVIRNTPGASRTQNKFNLEQALKVFQTGQSPFTPVTANHRLRLTQIEEDPKIDNIKLVVMNSELAFKIRKEFYEKICKDDIKQIAESLNLYLNAVQLHDAFSFSTRTTLDPLKIDLGLVVEWFESGFCQGGLRNKTDIIWHRRKQTSPTVLPRQTMREVIQNICNNNQVKRAVIKELVTFQRQKEVESVLKARDACNWSRQQVRNKIQSEQRKQEQDLNEIVKNEKALRAIKLTSLFEKPHFEKDKDYKVASKLSTNDERKVIQLLKGQ